MSKKTTTNLRIDPMTIGYLHYLQKNGEFTTLYGAVDVLVSAYMEHYAEEQELDFNKLNEECMELYLEKTRPQTKKSKKDQESSARNAMKKMSTNKRRKNDLIPSDVKFETGGIFDDK